MMKSARSSIAFAALATATVGLTVLTAATPAEARTTCKRHICLKLEHNRTTVFATIGWQGTGWDHFLVWMTGPGALDGGQFEVHNVYQFHRHHGKTLIFIQSCSADASPVVTALGGGATCVPNPAVRFSYRVTDDI